MATSKGPWVGLIVALLALSLFVQPSAAQRGAVAALDRFQCWNGVDLSGYIVVRQPRMNPETCARLCLNTPTCSAFTLMSSLDCLIKTLPFDAAYGSTVRNATFVQRSCLLKTNGGSLPSPENTMCFSGQNIAGFYLPTPLNVNTSIACASRCVSTPGCSFSVFWLRGGDGNSAPLCHLKSNPFVGGSPSENFRSTLVTSVCFRAVPAPPISDPLAAVAGPVPFIIRSRSTNRCLRPVRTPYSVGQALVFMSDCTGGEPLWTWDESTQVLKHFTSGLCVGMTGAFDGAQVVLSDNCAPSAANQVYSTVSGWVQVAQGYRYLQPVQSVSTENAALFARNNLPQEQFEYIPAAVQGFQCFHRVRINGDRLSSHPNVANNYACAELCYRSLLGCTSYVFQASSVNSPGTCILQTNAFAGGATSAAQANQVAASCLRRTSAGAAHPSPANYMCYAGQRASGTILDTIWLNNPQQCVDLCTSNSNCTYSLYEDSGICTIGRDVFLAGNSDNVRDPGVIQLCLRAKGAPDTIYSKGYTCFANTDISGDLVGNALSVPSAEACTLKCEEQSHLCSLAVYTGNQLCILLTNAFAGEFGTTGPSATRTACLRSLTGGPLNSPGNFLCYPALSISGTYLISGAGVTDSASCAAACAATPNCKLSTYFAAAAATCILKTSPFGGTDGARNGFDATVSGTCLAAPGAPVVTSGFGNPNQARPSPPSSSNSTNATIINSTDSTV